MRKYLNELIDKVRKAPANSISVNGKSFSGRNVTIINGKVIVDGKTVDMPDAKEIIVNIEGDLGSLQLDAGTVNVTGHAGDVHVGQGTAKVEMDVKGEVRVDQGKLECNDIFADVRVDMGNIKASTIHGNATTKMGNITK